MKQPEDFNFSVLDLGPDEQVGTNLKELIDSGHKITVDAVMNNGNLRGIATPGISMKEGSRDG